MLPCSRSEFQALLLSAALISGCGGNSSTSPPSGETGSSDDGVDANGADGRSDSLDDGASKCPAYAPKLGDPCTPVGIHCSNCADRLWWKVVCTSSGWQGDGDCLNPKP